LGLILQQKLIFHWRMLLGNHDIYDPGSTARPDRPAGSA
jgi:hypothetical protein